MFRQIYQSSPCGLNVFEIKIEYAYLNKYFERDVDFTLVVAVVVVPAVANVLWP